MATKGIDTLPGVHKIAIDSDLMAIDGVREVGDFYIVPRLDSHHGDLHYEPTQDVEALKSWCRSNPDCVGFNTLGFLKREIVPPHELKPSQYFSDRDGLYVFKERYTPGYTFFGAEVPKMVGSKPIIRAYTKPEPGGRDMMVVLPYFNFASSYRTAQNLLYVRETLSNSGIPYLVVEVAFKEDPFCVAPGNDVLRLRTESQMFYKENLLQIGVEHTPGEYTKFCFLDADVLFSDPNWYRVVSRLLDTHAAVHPFTNRYHLSAQFQIQGAMDYSTVVHNGTNGESGYAWAVTREWVEEYGIFDYGVMGAGDRAFTYCFCDQKFLVEYSGYRHLQRLFREYVARGPQRPGAFAPMTIFHMFHGSLFNRQYLSREEIINGFLSGHGLDDIEEVLKRRSDGLLEWREEYRSELNDLVGQFFSRRDDDSV
jgi:hypothetical protein